jgi:two-component system, LytTR family, response regulator LytT
MNLSVLLIEDDPFWSAILEHYLSEIGCNRVKIVDNLQSAKSYLTNEKPDCIIADVLIGEQKSYEILEMPSWTAIPKIFVTASESSEHLDKSLGIKHALFLVKPFHVLTLKAAMTYICKMAPKNENGNGVIVTGKQNIKIFIATNDIVFIKANLNYCTIKTTNSIYSLKTSIKTIMGKLGEDLVQAHRGYAINENYIDKVQLNELKIITRYGEVPIGKKYKKNIEQILAKKHLV